MPKDRNQIILCGTSLLSYALIESLIVIRSLRELLMGHYVNIMTIFVLFVLDEGKETSTLLIETCYTAVSPQHKARIK